MGCTYRSSEINILKQTLGTNCKSTNEFVVALVGNPNVGKSTVFNSLTGLNQHTGNWPGKTVVNAQGKYSHNDKNFILVDVPGTYSLMSGLAEEEIARNFICFGNPDVTVVVVDATCLERNLYLVLQVLAITYKVVVCVNLIDEAKRKKITIDTEGLSNRLGVPVVATSARNKKGLTKLMDAVYKVANEELGMPHIDIKYNNVIEKAKNFLKEDNINDDKFHDKVISDIVHIAEDICSEVVKFGTKEYDSIDKKIDKVLTSKLFGIPIMLCLLGIVFWITIVGANIPSKLIASFLFWVEGNLSKLFVWVGSPDWLHDVLVLGMYRTLAWVVSVMLPPMAIFFPLFTLMEDLGYLPRVAFNLDNLFKKACTNGKQALTMCMGFGCNAAGVIGCRIIDSPKERLIAIITNSFVPCNGRFPALIAISTIFIGGVAVSGYQSLVSTLTMMGIVLLGIIMTLVMSKILAKTILKGLPSSFALELPPYRKPQLGRILVRSIFDRTLFVLLRAVSVAAPAGIIIWIMANIHIGSISILTYGANFLQPFANIIGLDGYILMAFILGLPANEIVVPIIIMSYMSAGNMLELDSLNELRGLLISHGWTHLTAVCVLLFSLLHFPCATTLWTIKKETKSVKWTLVSIATPLLAGIGICFVVTQAWRLIL